MASDETPADVIEQAAKVMHATVCCPCDPQGCDVSEVAELGYAHALHDAGLLADPADRGEPYDQLDNQRNLWAKQCHEAEARAERVEAELDELRATVDRVTTLRDHWAHMAGLAMDADTREWLDAASKSLRAALDGGEQP